MKNFKHFTLLLLLLAVFALQSEAQTISYTYDQAGNRTSRTTITLPPQNAKRHTEAADSVVVNDIIGERTIKVYPNPTKGALGIEIVDGNSEDDMNITLFNGQGQALITNKASAGFNSLDFTRYPAGWYILQLQTGTTKKEYKIIKE
ncbi:MAG: T9SS type A sorting domain-containing protein [Paludibacter sp.]|nr:T9SS type A sorting domain-containing protein [Paludibacter sp.]